MATMMSDLHSDHLSSMGGGNRDQNFMYGNYNKNPSTAVGTYAHGFSGAPGYGPIKSTGGGKFASESFDLDIMMPPDIASIESDISKHLTKITLIRQAERNDSSSYRR